MFGAYFGLQVAFIVGRKHEIEAAEHKEASVYHSDLFAMIGVLPGPYLGRGMCPLSAKKSVLAIGRK